MRHRAMILRFLLPALACCCAAGCQEASTGYARYIPSAARSQEAMELIMEAWKNGEGTGPFKLKSDPITIRVADSTRRPGQQLVDYQVLGEISGEGPRTFVVRLKLENPAAEYEARYYLVGIDPLWVFRQEDYDAVVHWDACEPEAIDDSPHDHAQAHQPAPRPSGAARVVEPTSAEAP